MDTCSTRPAVGPFLGIALSGGLDEPFHQGWLACPEDDFRLRLARAQAAEMAGARPVIKPDELIVGDWGTSLIVSGRASPFGNVIRLNRERAEQLKHQDPAQAVAIDEVVAMWSNWLAQHPERQGMTCHASLAYGRVLEWGVDGLRAYVAACRDRVVPKRPESAPWYAALLVTVAGVSAFIEAHAMAATAAAAAVPAQAREFTEIAAACRHVAHGIPRSFREAVQLFYLLFLVCGHDSPGPVDRLLYPALKRDLAAGVLTLAEAQAWVDALWLKFSERTAYGATLAGQNRDGSDAANDMSHLCLEAIRRLRLLSPRTAVRWHPGLDADVMDHACKVIAEGLSLPALVNDEAIIAAAVERGMTLEDAREYTFVGCGQTFPHGRGHGSYEDVVLNSAKALEFALHDGVDPMTGQQVGPRTGNPADFSTYDAFERAYRMQMDAMISRHIKAVNEQRRFNAGKAFDYLRSLLTASCVETGRDWHDGGADYCEGMVDMVGLTTVTDSLVAIRMAVFDRRVISLASLVNVLDADWEGEEPLRQYFLRQVPKFGNEATEADDVLAAESARVNDVIRGHRTHFGGPWGMDIIGWSGAVMFGEDTGATPDGRHRAEALADCAGPAQGRNVQGLTATLNSACRLPHAHSHGPLVLSLRFPKESVANEAGRARLRAVAETYFRQGGQQLQISVASAEDMKAAIETPEAYRHLIVRVGGFSAYFTELDERWQKDMIARSEMVV